MDSQKPENNNKPLPEQTPDLAPEMAPVVSAPVITTKTTKRSRGPFYIVLLLIVAVAAVASYFLLHQSTKTAPVTQPTISKRDIPILRIGMQEGSGADLFPNEQHVSGDFELNNDIFDALVTYKDISKIVPNLAVSWTNPDSSTWVFKLRKDAKFHDGNAVTAGDVKASIEYLQKNNKDFSEFVSSIKEVTATDTNTVTIKTDGPDPVLLNKLVNVFVYDAKAPANTVDTGSGPYKIKPGTAPTANSIAMVANDNYWGGHVSTRELQYTIGNSADILASYKANKLDILADPPEANTPTFAGSYDYQLQDLSVRYMMLNTNSSNPPLNKPAVRQAIETALDQAAIAKAVSTSAKPASQILPAEITGYDPSIKFPTHSIAKAKELLNQAGYPNGFTMELDHTAITKPAADIIAKQLAAVGITAKTNELDSDTYLNDIFNGKHQAFILAYGSDFLDGVDFFSTLIQGTGYYDNPQIDNILKHINDTPGSSARLQNLQQVSRAAATDIPLVPLYTRNDNVVSHRKLNYHQDQSENLTGLEFKDLSQ